MVGVGALAVICSALTATATQPATAAQTATSPIVSAANAFLSTLDEEPANSLLLLRK